MELEKKREEARRVPSNEEAKKGRDELRVKTRHRVVSIPNCPACYFRLEQHITAALDYARAAVDAVALVEDFDGARDHISQVLVHLATATGLTVRLLGSGSAHEPGDLRTDAP
jgi:hypothetical protein